MGICWSECTGRRNKQYHTCEIGGGKVTLITSRHEWDEKLSQAKHSAKMVVANFSASWSTPCIFISSTYRKLAEKYDSLVFLTVDVDRLPEFSNTWKIKATPTFFFLKDGRSVGAFVGANEKELIKNVEAAADHGFLQIQ